MGGRSHRIGLEGEGPGAIGEQCGPAISLESLAPWNLSIFSRWPGRRQIRNSGEGEGPLYSVGGRSCSDPLRVACVCSVPGVTSLKMPEPGKKPGSSRLGVGPGCGAGGLGQLQLGRRLQSEFPRVGAVFQVFFCLLVSLFHPSDRVRAHQRTLSLSPRLARLRPGLPFGKRLPQARAQVQSRLELISLNALEQGRDLSRPQFPSLYKEALGWFDSLLYEPAPLRPPHQAGLPH